jgi:hypothetical protein
MSPLDRLADFHLERAPGPPPNCVPVARKEGPPLDHVPVSHKEPEASIYGLVEKILIGSIILLGVFAFAAGYSWGAI